MSDNSSTGNPNPDDYKWFQNLRVKPFDNFAKKFLAKRSELRTYQNGQTSKREVLKQLLNRKSDGLFH